MILTGNRLGVKWMTLIRKRIAAILGASLLMISGALADGHLSAEPSQTEGKVVRVYESPSLDFTVERFEYDGARCYLTRLWMEEPSRQIEKGTSTWRKNLMYSSDQAKKLPVKAMVVINGSGFVSPQYPQIPEDYPGKNAEYFYTPLGSLTITNGESFRNLEGVRFYGVTLESDGLHMYVDAENEEVLSHHPIHSWSFYDGCALVLDDRNLVDRAWQFANERNIRTIIGRLRNDTVFVLTVTSKTNEGLTMIQCADWVIEHLHPLWAFNLDGGPSSTLLVRPSRTGTLKTVYGNIVKTVDIMGFCELPEE